MRLSRATEFVNVGEHHCRFLPSRWNGQTDSEQCIPDLVAWLPLLPLRWYSLACRCQGFSLLPLRAKPVAMPLALADLPGRASRARPDTLALGARALGAVVRPAWLF